VQKQTVDSLRGSIFKDTPAFEFVHLIILKVFTSDGTAESHRLVLLAIQAPSEGECVQQEQSHSYVRSQHHSGLEIAALRVTRTIWITAGGAVLLG
jgi:hypothetical protein